MAGVAASNNLFLLFMLSSHLLCLTAFNPQKNTCEVTVVLPLSKPRQETEKGIILDLWFVVQLAGDNLLKGLTAALKKKKGKIR